MKELGWAFSHSGSVGAVRGHPPTPALVLIFCSDIIAALLVCRGDGLWVLFLNPESFCAKKDLV